jgi:hypothetical protein
MVWAPFEGFGGFDNALLVGNFGDGTINAFDFDSGQFLGKVTDSSGAPITIPGVWALQFGLGLPNSSSTIFFTAGIDDEQHGLLGKLTVNPSSLPPPEGVGAGNSVRGCRVSLPVGAPRAIGLPSTRPGM